jgi:hypothetical protein
MQAYPHLMQDYFKLQVVESSTKVALTKKEPKMPAVTVSDITVLPRVSDAPNSRARRVKSITTAPQGFEGEGFPVRRAFAGVDLAELDPFIHSLASAPRI